MANKAVERTTPKAKLPMKPSTPAMSRWEREFEHFLDEIRRLAPPRWWSPESWLGRNDAFIRPPSVDIVNEKDVLVVKAELPGLSKEDLTVEATASTLTIRGEKRREKEVKEENFYRSECEYGSVRRTIPLPSEVKTDGVKATFKDGVLEVRLAKTAHGKPSTVKIPVR